MKKETYSAPMIEEIDSKLLLAGAGTGTGTSTPDPDDFDDEI